MKVHIILRNADFTLIHSPMVVHKVYASGSNAVSYIKKQPGINGTPQQEFTPFLDGTRRFNGYYLRTAETED